MSRFTPGTGYLEALVALNSRIISNGIDYVNETGIRTVDGSQYDVDAIVTATGFDTSFRPIFPVLGLDGRNLADEWKDQPLHYMSVAASGFPNYFSGYPLPRSIDSPTSATTQSTISMTQSSTDNFLPLVAGGPNSPISNGSLISGLEAAVNYAFRCITKLQTENILSLEPKAEAIEEFLEHRDACMNLMVWSDECKSWFVPKQIRVTSH